MNIQTCYELSQSISDFDGSNCVNPNTYDGGLEQFYDDIRKIGISSKIIHKYFDPQEYQNLDALNYNEASVIMGTFSSDPDRFLPIIQYGLEEQDVTFYRNKVLQTSSFPQFFPGEQMTTYKPIYKQTNEMAQTDDIRDQYGIFMLSLSQEFRVVQSEYDL